MEISSLAPQLLPQAHAAAAATAVRRPLDNEQKTQPGEGPEQQRDGVKHASSSQSDQLEVRRDPERQRRRAGGGGSVRRPGLQAYQGDAEATDDPPGGIDVTV